MRDRHPIRIKDALEAIIDRFGMRESIEAATVLEAWEDLAGPEISGVTRSVRYEKGMLVVHITRSAWRQELHFHRTEWRTKLNAKLGRPIVNEIRFA